jgi:hypothetical protein
MTTLTEHPPALAAGSAGRHALADDAAVVQCGMCKRVAARSSMTWNGEHWYCGTETADPALRPVYAADVAACLKRWEAARASLTETAGEPLGVACGHCGHQSTAATADERLADLLEHVKSHASEPGDPAADEDSEDGAEDPGDDAAGADEAAGQS